MGNCVESCCNRCLPSTLFGKDINELLTYDVVKTTRIKDARLAVLQYLFMFVIVGYIVIYQICYKNGYLKQLPPVGTVLWSVQSPALPTKWNPTTHSWDTCCSGNQTYCVRNFPKIPYDPTCNGPPCDTTESTCFRNFSSLATLPYCLQNGAGKDRVSASGQSLSNYPCLFWDGAQVGEVSKNSMFLTSQVAVDRQIAHITPQTAPMGFKIQANTGLRGGSVVSTLKLDATSDTNTAICNAACEALWNCVAWTVKATTCTLLSNTNTDNNGVFALVPTTEAGTTAGLKQGGESAHSPGCGCKFADDTNSCYMQESVKNFGAVPGGIYNASTDGPREETFKCSALFHTKKIGTASKTREDSSFIADIERFTVSINHNVEQSVLGYTASAQSMKGWLQVDATTDSAHELCQNDDSAVEVYQSWSPFGFNGTNAKTNSAPCMILPKQDRNFQDYFPVSTLLAAAGIDLDSVSQGTSHSVRFRGVKAVLFIEYMNTVPFSGKTSGSEDNNGGITYIYKLQQLNSLTSMQDVSWLNYPLERLLLQRSGILLTAVQTGQVGKFDFATLMLTLTTSLTLLTVSGIIVKVVATKLIGEKQYYESIMVDESDPYTVVQQQKELFHMSERELRKRCHEMGLPSNGDNVILRKQILEEMDRQNDARVSEGLDAHLMQIDSNPTSHHTFATAQEHRELLQVVAGLRAKTKAMESILMRNNLMPAVKSEPRA